MLEQSQSQVAMGKKTNWTQTEDVALINAYLGVSEDPIIGTDQRGPVFWDKIHKTFVKSMGADTPRAANVLGPRYHKLNQVCVKFAACSCRA